MAHESDGDEPTVPIVCPACETRSAAPLSQVADAVASHNEQLHDGDAVAEVDPALRDHLADLVVEELGLTDSG